MICGCSGVFADWVCVGFRFGWVLLLCGCLWLARPVRCRFRLVCCSIALIVLVLGGLRFVGCCVMWFLTVYVSEFDLFLLLQFACKC